MTTIDLTVYNALLNDDGSNTIGTVGTKAAILLNPILTPVQTAITALDAAIAATSIAGIARVTAYNGSAQSLTTATSTALTFDGELFDTAAMHSGGGTSSQFLAPATGVYMLTCTAQFAANATGQRSLKARTNGTTDLIGGAVVVGNAGGAIATTVTCLYIQALTAADYIEFMAFQDSGGNLNVGAATGLNSTRASMVRLA